MKKGIIIAFSLIVILSNFVSAAPDTSLIFEQFVQGVKDVLILFVGPFFGGEGEFLFERVLFFVIVFSLVYVALNKAKLFEEHQKLVLLLVTVISLLSTRFLSERQLVENIIFPYTVLGIAITAIVPFIIYFFFTESFESSTIRKTSWIFFIVVFMGLWYSRYLELGQLSWIYFITGIIAFLLLLFDGSIRRFLVNQQMNKLGIRSRDSFRREIRREMVEADEDLGRGVITPSEHVRIRADLKKQLKAIMKN